MINYNNKCFKVQLNSENGETSIDTIFKYKQEGNIVSSIYKGGFIKYGQLIGVVDELGCINLRYQQINQNNEIKTGVCLSKPEILPNGKIRLHEEWQWTSGNQSKGISIIEEF